MKWNDGLETTLSKKEDSRLTEDKNLEEWNYAPIDMKKSVILERFRKNGGRVTRQRELLIDIILQGSCTSCKEIYVLASKKDPGIGIATVYRMIRSLEELGALKRKNTYQIYEQEYEEVETCIIQLEDDYVVKLDEASLKQIVEKGMKACGCMNKKKVKQVLIKNKGAEL